VWSLGDGLQGILSSTGQVQCGQVHCRLPYTAPPVHLKADLDGPLSSRGEKVNGAWLRLVGQSLPAGNGFLAAFPTTEWLPCHIVADHSGPQCGPKAVIRAATCVFHVPDFSEVLFVALSSLSLGSEAFLFTYALRFWGGFVSHTILLTCFMGFSSFVTVWNYWQ
jgi:hypothetical protein